MQIHLPTVLYIHVYVCILQKAEYLPSIHTNERFVFCAMVLVFSTVFLAFRSSELIPIIYIVGYYSRSTLLLFLVMTAGKLFFVYSIGTQVRLISFKLHLNSLF